MKEALLDELCSEKLYIIGLMLVSRVENVGAGNNT